MASSGQSLFLCGSVNLFQFNWRCCNCGKKIYCVDRKAGMMEPKRRALASLSQGSRGCARVESRRRRDELAEGNMGLSWSPSHNTRRGNLLSLGWRVNQNIRQTPLTGIKRRREVRAARGACNTPALMFYAVGSAFFGRENEAQEERSCYYDSSSYFFIQRARRAPDEIECARIVAAKSLCIIPQS